MTKPPWNRGSPSRRSTALRLAGGGLTAAGACEVDAPGRAVRLRCSGDDEGEALTAMLGCVAAWFVAGSAGADFGDDAGVVVAGAGGAVRTGTVTGCEGRAVAADVANASGRRPLEPGWSPPWLTLDDGLASGDGPAAADRPGSSASAHAAARAAPTALLAPQPTSRRDVRW
jgi:hypothetical protein